MASVDLDQYRIVKGEETKIELENENAEIDPVPVGKAKEKREPEWTKLSDILQEFNDINWQNIEIVKQQMDELPARLANDETFINAARNSNRETAQQQCAASMMSIIAQMISENTEFCRYYLDNPTFMNMVNQRIFDLVYKDITDKKDNNVNVTIENHYHGTIDNLTINNDK